jgi:hypothetical protein
LQAGLATTRSWVRSVNDLHFGVCIGIDRYPLMPERELGSASGDAHAFAAWLLDPLGGGLPPENVHTMTASAADVRERSRDRVDARPQRREVNQALRDVNATVQSRVGKSRAEWNRTRLYIYAAGHGIGPPNGEAALLMADANLLRLNRNVELSRYVRWYLTNGIVHELVVFADCCRELVARPMGNGPPFRVRAVSGFHGTVRYVGYASRLGEAAWEPRSRDERDQSRGYFTEAVLAGLRSAAADPVTGDVTAASLALYVEQAVERLTQGIAAYPQHGEHVGDLAATIVFRRGRSQAEPSPPIRAVKIRFPAGYAGEVLLRSARAPDDLFGRWRADDGPWSVYLPDAVYQVVPASDGSSPFQADGIFGLIGVDEDVQL